MALSPAFVAAPGPWANPPLRGAKASNGGDPRPADASKIPLTEAAVAAIALGAAASATAKFGASGRARRSAVARCAEGKFAGGLIGNESAFSSFDYNFDPLGIAERCPQYLPWFREAELKHGRICMLAWVGLVVPEFVRIPGPPACYEAPIVDAYKACIGGETWNQGPENWGPLIQVFCWVGLIEMLSSFPKYVSREGLTLLNAGDYRIGLQFLPKDSEKAKEMKLKELKNGRLAMLAFGGAITQTVLSGTGFPWMYAEGKEATAGCLASSVPKMSTKSSIGSSRVAMKGQFNEAPAGGYKMSKSVPFLPASPALEGYAGEEDGFDPMGFSLAVDIRWLREAELKHARVCMLATVGWIATDLGMRVPGEVFKVSTIDAHDVLVKFGAMPQMLVWFGYAELFGFLAIVKMMEGQTDRKPGDFGLRAFYPKDEKGQYDMQMRELRNGRLAMLAFSGIVTAAVLTGRPWPFFATKPEISDGTNFASGSTLCGSGTTKATGRGATISAKALEASKSLPFLPKPQNLEGWVGEEQEFDPLQFSDTFDMKWLREAELKHGRVSMLATVGFITQQYVAFPGFPTTSQNQLEQFWLAPAPAWATLIFLVGFIESSSYGGKITMLDMFEDTDREPGDFNFGKDKLNGKTEAEVKDLKLKELNNGRLAMMAIGGMVHHNLVVNGPLFPTFPAGWVGPQDSWKTDSFMTFIYSGGV
mmetsp:Transcript_6666/g.12403  ORF Transcript_6666/g.12403 Transcript_6666/m.12403 type:complete len:705 (-) Transcript_6666:86-2200(-)